MLKKNAVPSQCLPVRSHDKEDLMRKQASLERASRTLAREAARLSTAKPSSSSINSAPCPSPVMPLDESENRSINFETVQLECSTSEGALEPFAAESECTLNDNAHQETREEHAACPVFGFNDTSLQDEQTAIEGLLQLNENETISTDKAVQVHMAKGVVITASQAAEALNNKKATLLCKDTAQAIWGMELLAERSVCGAASPKARAAGQLPKEPLTPTKVDVVAGSSIEPPVLSNQFYMPVCSSLSELDSSDPTQRFMSGTEEQYGELQQLLQEVSDLAHEFHYEPQMRSKKANRTALVGRQASRQSAAAEVRLAQ
ncbi:hypothetical protein MTO96_052094 [Rhipicephalus appendiculatus]